MSITKEKIEALLAQYKTHHEGVFRKKIPWAAEPHIAELKPFVDSLPHGELSSDDRVKLAIIVRKKHDRASDTGSSRTFAPLAVALGSYQALDLLAENHLLNTECLDFIKKYPERGVDIAKFIGTMSKCMAPELLSALLATVEHGIRDKLDRLMVFFMESRKTVANYVSLLRLLNTHGISTYDVISVWPAISDKNAHQILELEETLEKLVRLNPGLDLLRTAMVLSEEPGYKPLLDVLSKQLKPAVESALAALSAWDRKLFTIANVNSFMQQDMTILELFSTVCTHLPPSQANLDTFLRAPILSIKSRFLPLLLINFKLIERDVTPCLSELLSRPDDYYSLAVAVATLTGAPLENEQFFAVFELMLKNRKDSPALAKAVLCSLEEPGSFLADLELMSRYPEHADQMLRAHKCIHTYGLLSPDAFIICEKNAAFAHGLSQFLVQWHRLYGTEKVPCAAVINKPECAEATAQVLDFLNTEQLANDTLINAICDAGLVDGTLLSFLGTIKQAGQLNPNNLHSLFPRLGAVSLLNDALNCLLRGGVSLDQTNYDTLLIDPDNAMAMALELGGKELEPEKPDADDVLTFATQDFELADHQPANTNPIPLRSIGQFSPTFFSSVVVASSIVAPKAPIHPDESAEDSLFSPVF